MQLCIEIYETRLSMHADLRQQMRWYLEINVTIGKEVPEQRRSPETSEHRHGVTTLLGDRSKKHGSPFGFPSHHVVAF